MIHHGKVVLEATYVSGEGLIPIQTLGAGEALGWSWLFPPHQWQFSARAVEPTEAVVFKAVAAGTPKEVLASGVSPTALALAKRPAPRAAVPIPKQHPRLTLTGAREHNLQDVTLAIPLARLSVVAGVSGSGKSTLVRKVLLPAVRAALGLATDAPGAFERLAGVDGISRALSVDQSPIGKTSRSVPATFLGIWDLIRKLYASSPEGQVRGFDATRFSFNSTTGGRCTACEGQGVIRHEMTFLPDVIAECPACGGARFEPQTLGVLYRDKSIADVLDMGAEEGVEHFQNHPKIAAPLKVLCALGAGYIKLGQGSHTLSGGEAQRLKLATELTAGARHEPTLYVLDEPTTGLHVSDVGKLLGVLGRLVERGDTVVVIEHHPDVIAGADWVFELGLGLRARTGWRRSRGSARRQPAAARARQTSHRDR